MTDSLALLAPVEPMRDARRTFTRNRIIAAARDIFAVNGFAGTTVEQIAQGAGTQRSTLYNHFRDKNEILAAIAQDYRIGLAALVDQLPGPVPTRAEIETWLGEVVAFSARERAPTILFMSLGSSADVPVALDDLGGSLLDIFAKRIPAFARALQPGEGLARARAIILIVQFGWLCVHHAQKRHADIAADLLTATAELFEGFLDKTTPPAP